MNAHFVKKIRNASDHKIIGYQISGQNITLDIRYPIGYPRRQFLRVGYIRPDSEKKKPMRKKIVILQQCIRYYSILNIHPHF